MVAIKICGITDQAGLEAAVGAAADCIGFVFFERSPRYISAEAAALLSGSLTGQKPKLVGLFVKATDDTIEETLRHVPLDILQIYDTPLRAMAIRERFNLPVWLSIAVNRLEDLPTSAMLDGYVIEPPPPVDGSRPGGNGLAMDWKLLKEWVAPAPWMLAGGLTPDNVSHAIRESDAPAVDVSSGVETAPGAKSPDLIRNFIKNVRSSCAVDKR